MLTLLGMVQGLALTHLAEKMPRLSTSFGPLNFLPLAAFLLCFLVVLRVFQAYVSASLTYIQCDIQLYDLASFWRRSATVLDDRWPRPRWE